MEMEGCNAEDPPVYYDASVKTPPFLFDPKLGTVMIAPQAQDLLNTKEVEGFGEEGPQFGYDASVKTPPTYHLDTSLDVAEMQNTKDLNPESRWDDVSSIGLLGVEGLRKKGQRKSVRNDCDMPVPLIITSGQVDKPNDNEMAGNNTERTKGIFRSSKDNKKTKSAIADLEIDRNPTFSTVWTGESLSSHSSGPSNDPEMQLQKEVSNTSSVSSEDSKQPTIDMGKAILTPRDWIVVVVILILTVTAIVIVVAYVYTSL